MKISNFETENLLSNNWNGRGKNSGKHFDFHIQPILIFYNVTNSLNSG